MKNFENWEFLKKKSRELRRRQLVIFEIGSSAVKKIQIDFEGQTIFWNQAELIELYEKEEAARKKEIVAALQNLAKGISSSIHWENASVFSNPQSFARNFFLPKMPLRELD